MIARVHLEDVLQTHRGFLPIEIFDSRIGIVAIAFNHIVGAAEQAGAQRRGKPLGG